MYTEHVRNGFRVLALAHRPLRKEEGEALHELSRENAEKGLFFAGFLVLDCPIKEDSFGVVSDLKASAHELKMITGDNELTAAHVAKKLGFADLDKEQESAFVEVDARSQELRVTHQSGREVARLKTPGQLLRISKEYMLVMNGTSLA